MCDDVTFYFNNEFIGENGKMFKHANGYGSGHRTVAVLLPGFAINW